MPLCIAWPNASCEDDVTRYGNRYSVHSAFNQFIVYTFISLGLILSSALAETACLLRFHLLLVK